MLQALDADRQVRAVSERRPSQLLSAWRRGDTGARDELVAQLYQDLRQAAGRACDELGVDGTLRPTALVHEVHLRFMARRRVDARDRLQFLAEASALMRKILVEHVRRKAAQTRREHAATCMAGHAVQELGEERLTILSVDRALTELEQTAPRAAWVVELRFFGGMTVGETAELLGVHTRTVEREWHAARVWLSYQLAEARSGSVD